MALPVGQWVQYNVAVQDPRAPLPDISEQTIGIVRNAFMGQGQQYYQVVWNPGEATPKSALYTEDQLCPLDQQTAQQITSQLASGTFTPSMTGTPGSQYQQPSIPTIALPPGLQAGGTYQPTPGQNQPPSFTETS